METLKEVCNKYHQIGIFPLKYNCYNEARPKARAILADLKDGDYSICEFDDSPHEQAIKEWLIQFIPAIGGQVFKKDNQRVFCFVV